MVIIKNNVDCQTNTINEVITTLDDVLKYNQQCLESFKQLPFFDMIQTLTDSQQRSKFLNYLQIFSNYFQKILLCRSATCHDSRYEKVFLDHFAEEFGHNVLLEKREGKKEVKDPIIEAIGAWFCYHMIIADNAEKAALVHLALEASADHFAKIAKPILGPHVSSGFFEIHAEMDDEHTTMGIALLKNLHSTQYKRIIMLLNDAWTMLTELTTRFVSLTHYSSTS